MLLGGTIRQSSGPPSESRECEVEEGKRREEHSISSVLVGELEEATNLHSRLLRTDSVLAGILPPHETPYPLNQIGKANKNQPPPGGG